MPLIPAENGIGPFVVLVVSTALVRLFWGLLPRSENEPKPTVLKSLGVAVAGGLLAMPFFAVFGVFDQRIPGKKHFEARESILRTDEVDRARRSAIETFRNYLRLIDRGNKTEETLPPETRRRLHDVRTIPYASGMSYTCFSDETGGPYLAVEPEIPGEKRYGIERDTFEIVEIPKGGRP